MAIEMKKAKVKCLSPYILACQYSILAKHLCMNFGMITLSQSINRKQNYATWILTVLLFILKPKIFMKTLLQMLKIDLTHQTIAKMIKDRFRQV